LFSGTRRLTRSFNAHFIVFRALKITLSDYNKYLEDLAKTKKVELEEIKSKMASCGAPGLTSQAVS